jgi:heparin binding hemagglutinin HbhA
MTSTEDRNRIPNAFYAAAGASDVAYQQLRKLPAKVAELRERASSREGDLRVDVERLRGAARRNAHAFLASAQVAQERASAIYTDLVARGEQVMRGGRGPIKAVITVGKTERTPAEATTEKVASEQPGAESATTQNLGAEN